MQPPKEADGAHSSSLRGLRFHIQVHAEVLGVRAGEVLLGAVPAELLG